MSNPTLTHGAAPESLVAGGPWTAAQSVSLERLAAALPTIDAHKVVITFRASNISTRSAIGKRRSHVSNCPMAAPNAPPQSSSMPNGWKSRSEVVHVCTYRLRT
jgi:hypothetical protein